MAAAGRAWGEALAASASRASTAGGGGRYTDDSSSLSSDDSPLSSEGSLWRRELVGYVRRGRTDSDGDEPPPAAATSSWSRPGGVGRGAERGRASAVSPLPAAAEPGRVARPADLPWLPMPLPSYEHVGGPPPAYESLTPTEEDSLWTRRISGTRPRIGAALAESDEYDADDYGDEDDEEEGEAEPESDRDEARVEFSTDSDAESTESAPVDTDAFDSVNMIVWSVMLAVLMAAIMINVLAGDDDW